MVNPRQVLSLTASLVVLSAPARSQSAGADTPSTRPGVYTDRQATRGESAYRKHCSACHEPAGHSGAEFLRAWTGRPLFELYDLIRTTMPNDNPGKLSRGQYAEIVAYLLRLNGYPAGPRPLPSDDDKLQLIRLDPSPP
jgi:mono/diheme cytochrome c family protein